MKRLYSFFIVLLFCNSVLAATSDSTAKARFKFGGRVDVMAFYDSYKLIDSRNGAQFYAPARPAYNSIGQDVNFQDQIRFSIATTRLNFLVEIPNLLGATGRGFVEIDFMGNSGENLLNMPRMRHAYFSLDWKRQSLLLGQTSHLALVDDIAANMVTFGGGWPFNPLSRPVQLRFTQKVGQKANFAVALSMFGGAAGVSQSYALLPDLHARFMFGNPEALSAGVVGGITLLKPRTLTADSMKTSKKLLCWDAAAYLKYKFLGHSVTLFGMVGSNLSRFDMMGGYAPLATDIRGGVDDYGYGATATLSLWADYQTAMWKGWQMGVFGGFQRNLGANKQIDVEKANIAPQKGLNYYWRVAPRITYSYKALTFGLEYTYTMASWADKMNDNYRPEKLLNNNFDNRITILARFKF